MRKCYLFVFLFVFLPSVALAAPTGFTFPHFAVGGGTEYQDIRIQDGWETSITIKSVRGPGSPTVPGKITWYSSDGSPGLGPGISPKLNIKPPLEDRLVNDNEYSFDLPPGSVREVVLSLPSPDITVGYVSVELISDRPGGVDAVMFLQYRYKVNGQVLGQATVTPVIDYNLTQRWSFFVRYFTGPNKDRTESGIALANIRDHPRTCTFTRKDSEGRVLDSFNEVIPRFGSLARFFSQLGPSLGVTDFEGSVDISCDSYSGMAAIALQTTGDGRSFNFSTIPNANVGQ